MSDSFKFYRLMYDTWMKLQDPMMRLQYFEAVMNYWLNGQLPDDPVMQALINGAVFSIDRSNNRNEKISDGMLGNSNARKTWDIVSKQMKTDGNRWEQIKQLPSRSIEVWSIEVWSNKEEENKNKKQKYGDFVLLTQTEHTRLLEKFWPSKTQYWIDTLNSWIGQIWLASANKKYKSHYCTILNWDRREWGKGSSVVNVDQALARQREKVREQIDEYLHPINSDDGSTKGQDQGFNRRWEISGS